MIAYPSLPIGRFPRLLSGCDRPEADIRRIIRRAPRSHRRLQGHRIQLPGPNERENIVSADPGSPG